MTFQVSMLLHADGDQATAEVRKVGAAVKETSAAADQLDSKGRKSSGGVKAMGSRARKGCSDCASRAWAS